MLMSLNAYTTLLHKYIFLYLKESNFVIIAFKKLETWMARKTKIEPKSSDARPSFSALTEGTTDAKDNINRVNQTFN